MDPFVIHVGHAPAPGTRLVAGAVAGLLATVVANAPMQRLPEGTTPPFVVAGALAGEELTEVSSGLASAVHYGAGAAAGLLFVLLAMGLERVLPPTATVPQVDLPIVPHVLAGLLTFAVLVGGFAYLVLPLFGEAVGSRTRRVRRDWTVSAAVYTAALLVFVPPVTLLV